MQLRVLEEALSDVVAIEDISGQKLLPCNGSFDDHDRVALRQTRLLWQGHSVRARLSEVTVTSPNGRPPRYIAIQPASIAFAGQRVPTPLTYATHPKLEALLLGPEINGDEPRDYRVSPPSGEHFIAWAPELLRADSSGGPAPWNLLNIDENAF